MLMNLYKGPQLPWKLLPYTSLHSQASSLLLEVFGIRIIPNMECQLAANLQSSYKTGPLSSAPVILILQYYTYSRPQFL